MSADSGGINTSREGDKFMITKICAECGKEFEASSNRVKYCSREHYRGCPNCGKPILIKYLSDPTPFCCRSCSSEFRKNGNKPRTSYEASVSEFSYDTNDPASDSSEDIVADVPLVTTSKSDAVSLSSEEYVNARYIGRTSCGFEHDKVYEVKVTTHHPGESRCLVESIQNVSDGVECCGRIYFSNLGSANRFFQVV